MKYIRIIGILILCLLLPLGMSAKRSKKRIPDKPVVADSILQNIFQFSPFYSRIIDEYKADLYLKGKLKVHKRNHLIRYVPSMFRFEKNVNDYMIESVSEMHYTAPDIYDRKIKAVSSTFPRDRGQIADIAEYLNMNIYSSSLMSDKLLSPLDKKASRYYTYLLDSVAGPNDCQKYKILIIPKFKGTQLVSGYMWVSDQVWTIRQLYIEGVYDVINFKVNIIMGEEGDEEFLPVRFDLNLIFKFLGNHLEMNCNAWMKYHEIHYYNQGEARRKSSKKHHHDLTESYQLTCDSAQLITDKDKFKELRPLPLSVDEDSLYKKFAMRRDTILHTPKKKKSKSIEFWGQLGDALISSYNVNLAGIGSVRCSPLINPVLFSYSHSRGFSYKQKFKYNRYFQHTGRLLRIVPQIGYNFTRKELYVKTDAEFQYWPEKQAGFEINVGNGNRIYSSVVLDQLKQLPDSTFNFDKVELDYFKDVYLNLFHNIEVVNGLYIKAGVSIHWRYLANKKRLEVEKPLPEEDWLALKGIRSEYNTFAPRVRIEWTPGMYYYMNGHRKMNVGSKMPTFTLDYERGIKGVLGSTGSHERWEVDVQQNLKLGGIRSLGYRIGGGMFTEQNDVYFVDFANFSRHNLPEGWNDEIGGTFQLLDGRWYNSSRQYWRGNLTYESPFILLKPLNRWLGMIQQERLYAGVLFMPHLNPYIELGYGIGTHIFDVGAFVSTINGRFDTFGFKFTFELFNK